jgi:hypothetical protein
MAMSNDDLVMRYFFFGHPEPEFDCWVTGEKTSINGDLTKAEQRKAYAAVWVKYMELMDKAIYYGVE